VFKTPYNHDTLAEALRTAQVNDEPSKTQQHFKDEADINEIMRRWLKTGEIKEIPLPPQYGDFTEMETDYHSLNNRIAETNALFYRLPAAVRASYQNDRDSGSRMSTPAWPAATSNPSRQWAWMSR